MLNVRRSILEPKLKHTTIHACDRMYWVVGMIEITLNCSQSAIKKDSDMIKSCAKFIHLVKFCLFFNSFIISFSVLKPEWSWRWSRLQSWRWIEDGIGCDRICVESKSFPLLSHRRKPLCRCGPVSAYP